MATSAENLVGMWGVIGIFLVQVGQIVLARMNHDTSIKQVTDVKETAVRAFSAANNINEKILAIGVRSELLHPHDCMNYSKKEDVPYVANP
jgi:hypothetical protein